MSSRRVFLLKVLPAVGAATLLGNQAFAQDEPLLDPKDPLAAALGYVHDATKVDKTKYPQHTATQSCANCALLTTKATDPTGKCSLFQGKKVTTAGWCVSWAKKP